MVPTLNDLALVNDIDDVRILDGAKPVSNRDCGAAFRNTVQRLLNDVFGGRIES
jgi:hypothetical protein